VRCYNIHLKTGKTYRIVLNVPCLVLARFASSTT
jgi:hypothetical protein